MDPTGYPTTDQAGAITPEVAEAVVLTTAAVAVFLAAC
jgi:hypothetical protein